MDWDADTLENIYYAGAALLVTYLTWNGWRQGVARQAMTIFAIASAYAVAWFIVDEIHIGNVAVRPEHQGQGIGQAVLRSILEEGERRGMTYATLEVRPSNTRALALYERFGVRRIAVRKQYYRDNREDALVLSLEAEIIAYYALLARLAYLLRENRERLLAM